MNLEATVPHEISQTQKDTHFMTAPGRAPEQTNPQTQKGSQVSRGCGRGTQGLVGAVSVWEDKEVLGRNGGEGCITG